MWLCVGDFYGVDECVGVEEFWLFKWDVVMVFVLFLIWFVVIVDVFGVF